MSQTNKDASQQNFQIQYPQDSSLLNYGQPSSNVYYAQQQQLQQQAPFSAPPTFNEINNGSSKTKTFNFNSSRYSLDGVYTGNALSSENKSIQNNRIIVSNNTQQPTCAQNSSGMVLQNLSSTPPLGSVINPKMASLQNVSNLSSPQYPTAISRLYSSGQAANQYIQRYAPSELQNSQYGIYNSASNTPQYPSYSYSQKSNSSTPQQNYELVNPSDSYYQPPNLSLQQHRHSIDSSNSRNCYAGNNIDGPQSAGLISHHRVPVYGNPNGGYAYSYGNGFGPTSGGYADLDYWDQIKSNVDRPLVYF